MPSVVSISTGRRPREQRSGEYMLLELAPPGELFRYPMHPYTKALLSAVPMPDPDRRLDLRALMEGKASDPAQWPEPFTDTGKKKLFWTEAEPGHYVRVTRGVDPC